MTWNNGTRTTAVRILMAATAIASGTVALTNIAEARERPAVSCDEAIFQISIVPKHLAAQYRDAAFAACPKTRKPEIVDAYGNISLAAAERTAKAGLNNVWNSAERPPPADIQPPITFGVVQVPELEVVPAPELAPEHVTEAASRPRPRPRPGTTPRPRPDQQRPEVKPLKCLSTAENATNAAQIASVPSAALAATAAQSSKSKTCPPDGDGLKASDPGVGASGMRPRNGENLINTLSEPPPLQPAPLSPPVPTPSNGGNSKFSNKLGQ